MQFEADREDRKYETWGEPSLANMTAKAINILKRGQEGFFLLVEGNIELECIAFGNHFWK